MSDFDKEAEREKLREKYERDQQEREATERMSDLLLKGATMTNAHCGTCGDPVFRHEGQEFCPTCQEVLREEGEPVADTENGTSPADDDTTTDGESAEPGSTEANATADATGTDVDESAEPRSTEANTTADVTTTDAESAASSTDAQSPPSADARASPSSDTRPTSSPGSQPDPTPDPATASSHSPAARGTTATDSGVTTSPADDLSGAPETTRAGGSDLAAARDSLSATVTELAANARRSDDLERTRAYLTAVEEAADALAAVKRADR